VLVDIGPSRASAGSHLPGVLPGPDVLERRFGRSSGALAAFPELQGGSWRPRGRPPVLTQRRGPSNNCRTGLWESSSLAPTSIHDSTCILTPHSMVESLLAAQRLGLHPPPGFWAARCVPALGGRPSACHTSARQRAKNSWYVRPDLQSFVLAQIARRGGPRTYNAHLGEPTKPPIMRSRVAGGSACSESLNFWDFSSRSLTIGGTSWAALPYTCLEDRHELV
jgi:hypothetical protein